MTKVSLFVISASSSLLRESIAISTLGRPQPMEGLPNQEMATTFAMPLTGGRDAFKLCFPSRLWQRDSALGLLLHKRLLLI
jgi:hypothetical protein